MIPGSSCMDCGLSIAAEMLENGNTEKKFNDRGETSMTGTHFPGLTMLL